MEMSCPTCPIATKLREMWVGVNTWVPRGACKKDVNRCMRGKGREGEGRGEEETGGEWRGKETGFSVSCSKVFGECMSTCFLVNVSIMGTVREEHGKPRQGHGKPRQGHGKPHH